jgi:8-oxo-dGTP diphosphatase
LIRDADCLRRARERAAIERGVEQGAGRAQDCNAADKGEANMSEIRKYTAAFLFRGDEVLLVRKGHPKWQAGMMNGIGGEIEEGEDSFTCIIREFHEEANLMWNAWDYFCTENGPGYLVNFYRGRLAPDDKYQAPATNDRGEELEWCKALDIKYPVIGNLHWLIPLALDPRPMLCQLHTSGDIRKLVTW